MYLLIKDFQNDEVVFDTMEMQSYNRKIELNNEYVIVNFEDLISTQFTEGNLGADAEELKKILNIGIYSKAPSGGFNNFFKVKGSNENIYVIYSGVNEVANSHYIVTIHKIFKSYHSSY